MQKTSVKITKKAEF